MNQPLKKPPWLTKKAPDLAAIEETVKLLESLNLNTVCDGADCPNRCECYGRKTATFMILGSVCTRQCRFCAVTKGSPELLDPKEPENIGLASRQLGLAHIVVTSVTRDDLPDGGADHFAKTVKAIRKENPATTIELLIPDMQGDWQALKTILDAGPDILNHNIETVPDLYSQVRPQANYQRSLDLLAKCKEFYPNIFTKSGVMVGLGEEVSQVYKVMDDLLAVGCDILTVGQYLQPSKDHILLKEYVHPDQFEDYRQVAEEKGFKYVASGPFVRSSYNAALGMEKVQK